MVEDPKDANESGEPQGFLSRWSKRKQATRDVDQASRHANSFVEPQEVQTVAVDDTVDDATPISVAQDQTSEDEIAAPRVLTDEDMPDVESMDEDSDYSGFMSEGVSEELRKLALRKLFSGAGFNIRDGLDDYDDDFRSFAALGDIITSDMKHQMEVQEARKKEAEKLAEEAKNEEQNDREGQEAEDKVSDDSNEISETDSNDDDVLQTKHQQNECHPSDDSTVGDEISKEPPNE